MSFIIYGMPRSRTFWLSQFLTYKDWLCGHDESRYVRSLDDIKSWFAQTNIGTVETGATPFWRLIHHLCPNLKTVVIRRNKVDILRSFSRLPTSIDFEIMDKILHRQDQKMKLIERNIPNILSFDFEDLKGEIACKQIFEHCLPFEHDPVWYNSIKDVNLQVHFGRLMEYSRAYSAQLSKSSRIAKQATLAIMRRPLVEINGITIKEEPFQTWIDENTLVKSHLARVGRDPVELDTFNFDRFKLLEEAGCLQTTVARCNGRVFGYLVTIIAPSLMKEGNLEAMHTTFFSAAEDIKGLGSQIMQTANELLRQKGISEIAVRTGPHDSAPAIEAIVRRLGAKEDGKLFILNT